MFSSNILDIAITLGFTFLLLALIVSTMTEIFNTVMQRRSKYLQRGLKALFDNISINNRTFQIKKSSIEMGATDDTGKTIYDHVINSPFIKVLKTEPGITVRVLSVLKLFKWEDAKFPNYITPNTLALAVMDVLDIKSLATPDKENVKTKIKEMLKKFGEPKIQNLLLTIVDNSVDKDGKFTLKFFTEGIEKTFNDCMDRVTGIYKRKSQWISFILSIIVVLLINVDTLRIVKTLQTDKDLLENAVTVATNSYKQFDPAVFSGDSSGKNLSNNETESLEVVSTDSSRRAADTVISIRKSKNNIKVIMNKLNETKMPIGWEHTVPCWNEFCKALGISIFGWLISILAIYLGAPFWFDVLNKFTNIRGAGVRPPTTGETKESEKKS